MAGCACASAPSSRWRWRSVPGTRQGIALLLAGQLRTFQGSALGLTLEAGRGSAYRRSLGSSGGRAVGGQRGCSVSHWHRPLFSSKKEWDRKVCRLCLGGQVLHEGRAWLLSLTRRAVPAGVRRQVTDARCVSEHVAELRDTCVGMCFLPALSMPACTHNPTLARSSPLSEGPPVATLSPVWHVRVVDGTLLGQTRLW